MVLIKNKFNLKLTRWDLILIVGMILYSVFFSLLELYKLSIYLIDIFDLAIFNQSFWTTVNNGGFFLNTIEGCSHLGVHFSPILLILLPFYYFMPGPETLMIAQNILLALGALPIYLCAKEFLSEKAGCLIGLTYLLYPSLHGVSLFEFHEIAFLPFFLGMALWGLLSGRKNLCLIFCLLCMCVKEDVSLIVFMIGLVGLYKNRSLGWRDNWQYLAMLILPVILLLSYHLAIKPYFAHGNPDAGSQFLAQYSHPIQNVSEDTSGRLIFILKTFIPLLFIPFVAPEVLVISVPSLMEILFSQGDNFYNTGLHYSALIIPVIFMSLIVAFKRIKEDATGRLYRFFKPLVFSVFICTLICSLVISPAITPVGLILENYHGQYADHNNALNNVVKAIPESASVATQFNLLPSLSNREKLWWGYKDEADVTLVDTSCLHAAYFEENAINLAENYTVLFKYDRIYLFVKTDNNELQQEILQNLHQS